MHLVAVGYVHDAVVNQRRGLQVGGSFDVVGSSGHQRSHIGRGDLLERTVAVLRIVARIRQPVGAGAFTDQIVARACARLRGALYNDTALPNRLAAEKREQVLNLCIAQTHFVIVRHQRTGREINFPQILFEEAMSIATGIE